MSWFLGPNERVATYSASIFQTKDTDTLQSRGLSPAESELTELEEDTQSPTAATDTAISVIRNSRPRRAEQQKPYIAPVRRSTRTKR